MCCDINLLIFLYEVKHRAAGVLAASDWACGIVFSLGEKPESRWEQGEGVIWSSSPSKGHWQRRAKGQQLFGSPSTSDKRPCFGPDFCNFHQVQMHQSRFVLSIIKRLIHRQLHQLSTWGWDPVLQGALFHIPWSNHLSRTRLVISSHAERLPAGGTWFHLCAFSRLWQEINSCRIYQMSLYGVGCFEEQKSSSVYA